MTAVAQPKYSELPLEDLDLRKRAAYRQAMADGTYGHGEATHHPGSRPAVGPCTPPPPRSPSPPPPRTHRLHVGFTRELLNIYLTLIARNSTLVDTMCLFDDKVYSL